MDLEQQIELIQEYQQWAATQHGDKSAAAFAVYRAQNEAYQRVEKALAYLNTVSYDDFMEIEELEEGYYMLVKVGKILKGDE